MENNVKLDIIKEVLGDLILYSERFLNGFVILTNYNSNKLRIAAVLNDQYFNAEIEKENNSYKLRGTERSNELLYHLIDGNESIKKVIYKNL